MSFFNKITSGRIKKPFFLCLYSGPGVGKTDFAASFPDPFFYDFEESTHMINVKRHRPLSFQEILDDLEEILERDTLTEFKTMVFDTIDEMERLIHWHVADEEGKGNIRKIGWQKGYSYAVDYWAELVSMCRQIRDKHKINFVFLAHAYSRSVTSIEAEVSYSKNSMALHAKAADYIFGQVEMVLFARKDFSVKVVGEKSYVKDLDTRTLCTSLNATYDAKNRIGLPSTIPMPYNNAYGVLKDAYDRAYDETPEKVYQQCLDLIKNFDDDEKLSIKDYCDQHKDNLAVLRICLERIEIRTKEHLNGNKKEA